MLKITSGLVITTLLLGLSTPLVAQECVNCWINPKTGKQESLDQSTNATPTSGAAPRSPQTRVIVYGRRTCGLTTRMMKQLDASRISYQFKNVDDRATSTEMWGLLSSAGLGNNRSIRLPILSVKGKTLVNATLADVQTALR